MASIVMRASRKTSQVLAKIEVRPGYQRYRYHDYALYRATQEAGNKRKIKWRFVEEPGVMFLSGYIRERLGQPRFGICHGTRRGDEQAWFRRELGCEVIDTEISETAKDFPHTFQWDFHETKPEWVGAVDFIYSNSWDHSYEPERALTAWMSCLRPGGICILEHRKDHAARATSLDPFAASIEPLVFLIAQWGRGKFSVREILTPPSESTKCPRFLAIQNWS